MYVNVRSREDLREFASYLRSLAGKLTDEFSQARQSMYKVNEGWQDNQNQRFMEEFEQSVELINQISEHMVEYSSFLHRCCDILDEYDSLRMNR